MTLTQVFSLRPNKNKITSRKEWIIKTIIPPGAEDLVNYFDSVYVSDPLR